MRGSATQTFAQKPSTHSQPAARRAVASPKTQPQTNQETPAPWHRDGEPAPRQALAFDLSRISVHPRAGAVVQTKLTLGAPGDRFEQEADRVAERIARMAEPPAVPIQARAIPAVQRQCACGGTCAHCQEDAAEEEHGHVQRKPAAATTLATAPPIVHQAVRSAGQPLAPATRAFFEPRLGFDFSTVRIHTDAQADASARAIQARAYTVGRNVVFAGGQFAPETMQGRALLAHELTHVVQQGGAQASGPHPTAVLSSPGMASPSVQRACDPKAIPKATGCVSAPAPAIEPKGSNPFVLHFEFACDTFKPGEETRLRLIALALAGTAVVTRMHLRLDGFASDEGDKQFNEALSCARARKVQAILEGAGVRATVKIFSHGGTTGDRPDHRSVVLSGAVEQAASTPVPVPVPIPKPPEPKRTDDLDDDSDLWPKWRKGDPWWKRIFKRLHDLTDLIRRGVEIGEDIVDELNDLRKEIQNRLIRLLPLLLIGGLAELPELYGEVKALQGLLRLLNRMSASVPQTPYNDFPPGAGPGSRYEPPPDWKPDPPKKPQDKPQNKPEKKPDPEKKKPDDKKKKEPRGQCFPVLYLPIGKLPHLWLYQMHAGMKKLRGYPTEVRDKQRTSAYERDSHQIAVWMEGMRGSKGMKAATLARGKQMLRDDGECRTEGNCEMRVFIPNWDRNGNPVTMNVDHIRELQLSFDLPLSTFDTFTNMELLDESTNKSSGSTLDHALQAERERLNRECPEDFDWQHVGLIFAPPVLIGGGKGPGIRWSREEIIAGKHLNAYRPKRKKKK